ncbi:MAG: hypothetical protein ACE366_16220 [Bradymonadia bacterium]
MRRPIHLRRLCIWSLALSWLLSGCVWDTNFFDDYSEAGLMDFADMGAEGPLADMALPADAAPPPTTSGLGPDCSVGGCGLVTFTGSAQLAGLAADDGGGAWVLINGPVSSARSGGQDEALDPNAPGHLIHITGGGFVVDFVAPLPFRGTGLAATNTAVFVSGHNVQAGEFLDRSLDPAQGNAIIARIANQQLQWWVTWSSSTPPKLGSEGPTAVWIAGSPGNPTFTRDGAATPFFEGSAPDAPGQFVARFTGLGDLEWLQPFGAPDASTALFDVGPGGHGVIAATGNGTFWDGTALSPVMFTLAQINSAGGIIWTQPSTAMPTALAVDPGGRTWMTARVSGDPGELPVEHPEGEAGYSALGLLLPNGIASGASALVGPQGGTIDAIGASGSPLVLGQTYGEGSTTLAERTVGATGLFIAGVNANVRSTWMQRIGPPSPNAPQGRAVSEGGQFQFIAADAFAPIEWGGETSPYAGQPTVVVLRFPTP